MSLTRLLLICGVLLSGCLQETWALSLGPAQGQAWLGQRLHLQIPLYVTPEEAVGELCIQALPLGDADELPLSLFVDVHHERHAPAMVHVRSRQSVQDLTVNFRLSAGCHHQTVRAYTLLVDLLPTSTSASSSSDVLSSPHPFSVTPHTQPSPSTDAEPSPAQPVQIRPSLQRHVPSRRNTANHHKPEQRTHAAQAGASTLRLEWLTDAATHSISAPESFPRLKLAPALFVSAQPLSPEQEAVRQTWRDLWQAIQTPMEEQKNQKMSMLILEESLQKKEQSIQQIQASIAKLIKNQEEEQRTWYLNPGLLSVLALLFISWMLFGFYLIHSQKSQRRRSWWRSAKATTAATETESSFNSKTKVSSKTVDPSASAEEHLDLDSLFTDAEMPRNAQGQHPSVPVSTSLKETLTPDFEVSGFSHSTIAEATRSLATEELFDLQQQVEFFISLGQAHQAIEVLKAHIAESTEPSPLAYLDLLKLLHDLGQRDTYEAVRNAFNTKFNASSPPFEKYSYSRRSLERYSFALSRIQALWPSPAVLTLLERTIFRQNQSHSDEQEAIFDLEAYRELLLLYGIARELNAHASSGDGTSSLNSLFSHRRGEGTGFEVSGFPQFDPTSLQPLNASMGSDNHRQYTAPHTNPLPDLQEEVHMPDVLLDTIQTSMHTLSAFDPNATTAVPPKTTTKTTAAPETFSLEKANDLVLDFSDLDAPDSTYTIKKSGHSDPNTF